MVAQAWATFPSLGSAVTIAETPQARLVGDVVQLRGDLTTTGAGSTKWGSVPSGMAPAQTALFAMNTDILGNASGSTRLAVNPDGTVTDAQNHYSVTAQYLPLTGLSYPLV
jgi:hypothetical protein